MYRDSKTDLTHYLLFAIAGRAQPRRGDLFYLAENAGSRRLQIATVALMRRTGDKREPFVSAMPQMRTAAGW